MQRQDLYALFAVALLGGAAAFADDEKPAPKEGGEAKAVVGNFVAFKDGVLVLRVSVEGRDPAPKEFKVGPDVKVVVVVERNELVVKDGLASLREGTRVMLKMGEGGQVAAVVIGAAGRGDREEGPRDQPGVKPRTMNVTFVSYQDGLLTFLVPTEGGEGKPMGVKLAADSKLVLATGDRKTETTAREAFQGLKEGAALRILITEGDKLVGVQVGPVRRPDGDRPAPRRNTVAGLFLSFKDGVLTVAIPTERGQEPRKATFKVAGEARAVVGEEEKETTAREALQNLKEGTPVQLRMGDGERVIGVVVGGKKD